MQAVDWITSAVETVNGWVWSPALVVLCLLAALYFSFRTRFVQVRRFGEMFKLLFGSVGKDKKSTGISSFQAFAMALSGRVGTGNIVGVATAIGFGGPGAIVWMWIIAFFGAGSAFVEATLAQIYKEDHNGQFRGGPAYYIEKGLRSPFFGALFAVLTALACGIFLPPVQGNSIALSCSRSFGIPAWIIGIIVASLLALVIIGGVKRIANVAQIVAPVMAMIYIVLAIVVLLVNWQIVPEVFMQMLRGAVGVNEVSGALLGSTIAWGVKRGIYSNEAGQGTGAIVAAAAKVSHPVKQGLVQAFSVYIDTLLVCTATALMILCSGTYNILNANGELLYAGAPELANNYVNYTQSAVDTVFKGFGSQFVSIAMVFFAFSTIMAYYFYAETSIIYLFRGREGKGENIAIRCFQVLMLAAVVFGAVREADVVWQLGDIGVGLMAWVTVVSILILCPKAIKALKEFEKVA